MIRSNKMSLITGIAEDLASLSTLTKTAASIATRVSVKTPLTTLARGRTRLLETISTLYSGLQKVDIPADEIRRISTEVIR